MNNKELIESLNYYVNEVTVGKWAQAAQNSLLRRKHDVEFAKRNDLDAYYQWNKILKDNTSGSASNLRKERVWNDIMAYTANRLEKAKERYNHARRIADLSNSSMMPARDLKDSPYVKGKVFTRIRKKKS